MNDDLGLVTLPRRMLPLFIHQVLFAAVYLDRVMLKYAACDLAKKNGYRAGCRHRLSFYERFSGATSTIA